MTALLAAAALSLSLSAPSAGRQPVKVVGSRHTLVLFSDGAVMGWGPCDWGEIGPIAAVTENRNWAVAPVTIPLPGRAIDVAACENASFALLEGGTVVAWGSNYDGMLGTDQEVTLSNGKIGSEKPVSVSGLAGISKIAAAGHYALALTKEGTVFGWGRSLNKPKPALIDGLTQIKTLSASSTHVMALDASGDVWTLGGSMYGALGRMDNVDGPGKVAGVKNVVSIAAGLGVSTVAKKDGTVWVWGSNWQGQFGNGKQTAAPVYGGLNNEIDPKPRPVPGVANAVAVTSGLAGRHTLALLRNGALRGWGNTDWGQIGAGKSGTFQLTPTTPKITGVKAVFAVSNNSFAVKADGSLWIWGNGHAGEFPLAKVTRLPVPLSLK